MFVFVFKSWHCSRYLLIPHDVTWSYPRGITWMIGTTPENHNITKINWGVFIYWLASIITHIIFIFPVVKDWSDMKLIQMITWINSNNNNNNNINNNQEPFYLWAPDCNIIVVLITELTRKARTQQGYVTIELMIYRIILEGVRPKAEVDNTLLDLHNSSYPTQPHSLIVKYSIIRRFHTAGKCTF